MKKRPLISLLLILTILITGCENTSGNSYGEKEIVSTYDYSENEKEVVSSYDYSENEKIGNLDLEVHFIDVGQGDAILIESNDKAMMVDFGNNDKGSALYAYLKKEGIDELEYAIGTHPDADHIGGMDVILYKTGSKRVFMPDVTNDTATYRDVVDECKRQGKKIENPKLGESFSLGDVTFTIISPVKGGYEDKNSYSIGIKLVCKNTSFVMCGDETIESEKEMLANNIDLQADVLKLGHHGSSGSTCDSFLTAVNPKYAIISCGFNNSYGHPHKEVVNALKNRGISLFRTDLQGSIIAKSDGENITFNTQATTDYRCGNEISQTEKELNEKDDEKQIKENDDVALTSENTTYIINENTKKFHLSDCPSVSKMKEKNKKETNKTKDELEKEGYQPCQNCLG
ncbi:Metal-dependent hydrolase, beta-lactamase superfamily II [Acetitomaculum ruminis DSM 5522]|uniref:Metal-dependent hydrolase, beta-lactamase superfamily II n=1 Tax=Acetitomaculum ruminis DSM 5522 TaxID=1120918 RepID=A0A1I0YDG0_9FIRM|nr:ComEC/Rec2 family competence protein [Acetitomaculum ruminis]SFB10243.1 Metal-dependent hydrolase, beta-lactamase superfamily II [Acetitomaculum ruminis DSM 5522]